MGRLLTGSFFLAVGCAGFAANACDKPIVDPGFGSGTNGVVHPLFGPTTMATDPPPPISGGTLLIAREGLAVAADPDRDAVYVVDLATRKVTTLAMQKGDEPGRLVEDGAGRVHVVLRSGGALATIDLASRSVVDRRQVCVAPRGVDYDPSDASLYVACASGELVELPAAGGPALRTLHLERDLRDVVVKPGHVVVTQFRAAQAIIVDKVAWAGGQTWAPSASADQRTASVAWRTLSSPGGGGTVMLHQRGASSTTPVSTDQGGYASGSTSLPSTRVCAKSIVETTLSFADNDVAAAQHQAVFSTPALSGAVVPVDFAISPDGSQVAIAAAGNAFTPGAQSVLVFDSASLRQGLGGDCVFPGVTPQPPGQATALAFTSGGKLVVQTREPAALFLPDAGVSIRLSTISRADTGHDVFHANSGGEIACASCHPEGGDDGRVWSFDQIGPRRTPTLRGTVADTAPYHWGGEMKDFDQLAHDVFSSRMSGPTLPPEQSGALSRWVNRIPAPAAPAAVNPESAARGKTLFEGAAGCSSCHNGPRLTNNATVDVGTGAPFQVPPLVGIAYRAPFQHDGCAATLTERFTNPACNQAGHGNTQNLSKADVADLVAYLGTL